MSTNPPSTQPDQKTPPPEKPRSTFIHLHTHSHYSLLDGVAQIKPLVAKAKEFGMSHLALTDHGAMYGLVEFYQACKKAEITPILGAELYVAPRSYLDKDAKLDSKASHIVLLAENFTGYQNLIALTTEAQLNGFYYKPRIDKALLEQYKEGLIATSACCNGEVIRALSISYDEGRKAVESYLKILGPEHFVLEIQHRPEDPEIQAKNQQVRQLAKEYGLMLVATNDCHYINPDDNEAQDVLVCVGTGKQINDPGRLSMLECDLHFASPTTMAEWFQDCPEALENTVKIAERCKVELTLGKNILPVYPLPDAEVKAGTTDRTYLRKVAAEGIKFRYGFDYTPREDRPVNELLPSPLNDPAVSIEQRVKDRFEYELSVIEKMGFESYFLIVQDFIVWAKDHGIMVGPGRGSGAGSLIAYLTRITDVDPLEHNLIFERFLNPERISMPDFDNDIQDSRRDDVIAYVRERYGVERVAQIITFGTMAARNAIRDVGRVLGVSYAECDYLAKLIPSGPGGMTLKEARTQIEEVKSLYNGNEDIRHLMDVAERLEGVARHTSIHAAGVVITKDPLIKYVPLQRAVKNDNAIVTQYAMHEVEDLGLLKMDFLGLANLNIIYQALRVIRKTQGVEINLSTLPLDDAPAYELLARAESTGVFQLESSGMKRYLKELKPTQFEDIVAMVALYRPGPMDAIPDFIESKHGRREITYLHPILEPILKSSYGVIVMQDQVLEVARKFAGFSYGEADILRKAVGKKIKALLDEQREKFVQGAIKTHGVKEELARKVWDFVEPFARYGFNRAHAVCYSFIAYQTAYLKAHYPVEFMSALLTCDTNNLDRIGIEIAECKEMGIAVLPPDVNESFVEFGVIKGELKAKPVQKGKRQSATKPEDRYIRFGLGAIKNVGLAPSEAIVEERKQNGPFAHFSDFLTRCTPALNKKVLENLSMAGAFDSLVERQKVLTNMETILAFLTRLNKEKGSNQIGLFSEATEVESSLNLDLVDCPPAPPHQNLAWERELLGIYISDHPISPYLKYLPEDRLLIAELAEQPDGLPIKICGVVMSIRKILTKNNQTMAFVAIEDESGPTEAVVFPRTWAEKEKSFIEGRPIYLEGKITRKESRVDHETLESKILVDRATLVSAQPVSSNLEDESHSGQDHNLSGRRTKLDLFIPRGSTRTLLTRLKDVLEQHPGSIAVTLHIPNGEEGEQILNLTHKVKITDSLAGKLINLLGRENIQ